MTAEPGREPRQGDLCIGPDVEFFPHLRRLGFGGTDGRAEAWRDGDITRFAAKSGGAGLYIAVAALRRILGQMRGKDHLSPAGGKDPAIIRLTGPYIDGAPLRLPGMLRGSLVCQ